MGELTMTTQIEPFLDANASLDLVWSLTHSPNPTTLFDACHTTYTQLVSTSGGQQILPYSHLIGLRPS